jgi:hypothetical protein
VVGTLTDVLKRSLQRTQGQQPASPFVGYLAARCRVGELTECRATQSSRCEGDFRGWGLVTRLPRSHRVAQALGQCCSFGIRETAFWMNEPILEGWHRAIIHDLRARFSLTLRSCLIPC